MRIYFSYILILLAILISSRTFGQTTTSNSLPSDLLAFRSDEKTDLNESFQSFKFFGDDFNFLSFKKKNISIGIDTFFEEDLPDGQVKFSDFFVYDFGVNFFLNQCCVSLFLENFFNLNSKELSIAPAYHENMSALVYLEHDTPSMIHLSLVYSF